VLGTQGNRVVSLSKSTTDPLLPCNRSLAGVREFTKSANVKRERTLLSTLSPVVYFCLSTSGPAVPMLTKDKFPLIGEFMEPNCAYSTVRVNTV